MFIVNWLDFMCRVGATVAAVAGTAATGAAAGALSGSFGGPVGAGSGAIAGVGIGVVGGLTKSGDICDQATHDMYMRQKCEAVDSGEMFVRVHGMQVATVKQLAERGLMPLDYYKDIAACEEAGHLPQSRSVSPLPTDSKGMVLP